MTALEAVRWDGDAIVYLDQRLLPGETRYVRATNADEIEAAIKTLAVRGAPCIGVFGAYGVALLRATIADGAALDRAVARVRSARPTAVNLAWAVDRVLAADDPLAQARAIHREQIGIDQAIGIHGLELIAKGARILTHCNTGPLATAGGGTAVGVILAAQRAGKRPRVFVDETRPLLQGSRLNYLELSQAGVDVVLQIDAAAAVAMAHRGIDLAIVGADRVARNGDTANKSARTGSPFWRPITAFRSTWRHRVRRSISRSKAEKRFGSRSVAPTRSRRTEGSASLRRARRSTIRLSTSRRRT